MRWFVTVLDPSAWLAAVPPTPGLLIFALEGDTATAMDCVLGALGTSFADAIGAETGCAVVPIRPDFSFRRDSCDRLDEIGGGEGDRAKLAVRAVLLDIPVTVVACPLSAR